MKSNEANIKIDEGYRNLAGRGQATRPAACPEAQAHWKL
jgi:hypothetical protein